MLSQLVSADFVTRVLTCPYGSGVPSRITTDLEVAPTFNSANSTYCVNASLLPVATVYSDWYSSVYDTALKSNANTGTCLVPSTTVNQNQAIQWLTSSTYSCAFGSSAPIFFNNVPDFASYMQGCSAPSSPESIEKSKYIQPDGTFFGGSTDYYKAGILMYCKGTVSVVSSNPSYSLPSTEYTGSNPIFPPIPLPAQPTSLTFQTMFNMTECASTFRSYLNGCAENVRSHKNTTLPSFIAYSTAKSITVKYPFNCSAVQFSNGQIAPTNATPGQLLSFSFSVLNPTTNGESAKITNVSTSGWSPQPSPQPQPTVNSGLPQTIANNGVPYTISGTLAAPSAPGNYSFNLIVKYSSSNADCSGATKNCSYSFPFTITVQPSANNSPASCTLVFLNHGNSFTAPDSAVVNATCHALSNAAVPCGFLAWSTNATGGSVSPSSTISPPQFSQTTFSIAAVHAPQSASVKAQQANNFSCTIALSIIAPDYISTITAPAQVQAGTAFNASVETRNIGAASDLASITRLQFNGATQNFNIKPLGQQEPMVNSTTFTCPATPGTYLLTSLADATGIINESNENNNNDSQWVNCTAGSPGLMPDYISQIQAPLTATAGTSFNISITTKNIGNAPATVPSTTRAAISNQPNPLNFIIRPLGANNDFVVNSTTAACPATPGFIITINSSADFFSQISESNELNNNATASVLCVNSTPSLKPNYVPNITAPSVAFLGIPFAANFSTKNNGSAPGLVPSITRVTFQSAAKDFPVVPLAVLQEQIDPWNFTCTSPSAILEETVDFTNAIDESNEFDNVQSKPIACYTAPLSCNLAFVGHNSTLFPPDSAQVQATCFAGGVQTACPPFLWQQNIAGGNMFPPNTPADWMPNSTLSIFSISATQLGGKVNATSTLPSIPIYCELPFIASNGSAIGPDYVVTTIIPDHPVADLGQVVQFTVTVRNQGNVNAINDSTSTAVYSPGCEIITGRDSYFLPHIDAQDSKTSANELACTCRAYGAQNITVTANPMHAQWETNFNNNDRTQPFICQAPAQPIMCSYFV